MEKKYNILFDFDVILQGYFEDKSKGGVFWTEYRILSEFIKNHSDNFNFYVHCSCTENFYNNILINKYPEFKSLKFLDIYSMNKLNINKIKFFIKYFKFKGKKNKNVFGKISYRIFSLFFRLIKPFFSKDVECGCNLDFIHYYQSFLGTTGIPEIINKQNFKKFTFLYDVLPVSNPEYFFKPKKYKKSSNSFSKKIKTISKDTTVFVDSMHAKDEFLKYFPEYTNNNVIVIYLGVDEQKYFKINNDFINKNILSKYSIPRNEKYILSLCSLNKRKNLAFLVESFVEFLEKNPEIKDLNLVLAGPKGWLFDDVINSIKNTEKYKNKIILTGFIDDDDINEVYNSAYAFVYPSVAEGFGLPVLEAMRCGIPVLSSNATSLPEVYGEAALSFDPYKKNELIDCLHKIYYDKDLRNELIQKEFKQSEKFSWKKTVDNMIGEYLK